MQHSVLFWEKFQISLLIISLKVLFQWQYFIYFLSIFFSRPILFTDAISYSVQIQLNTSFTQRERECNRNWTGQPWWWNGQECQQSTILLDPSTVGCSRDLLTPCSGNYAVSRALIAKLPALCWQQKCAALCWL